MRKRRLVDALPILNHLNDFALQVAPFRGEDDLQYQTVMDCMAAIEEAPIEDEWIKCSEKMPPEHDSIFAKFKGTDKWKPGMFEKRSDDVNVTVEFENGTRKSETRHTVDGKWDSDREVVKREVIAWKLLPEPMEE